MALFRRAPKLGVLFVCMGNICRSPTAEGVFRHRAGAAGLLKRLRVDSAGTHAGLVGVPPDARAIAAAARRDYDLRRMVARRITAKDFTDFHYVLAMDSANLRALEALRPETTRGHVGLLMDFAPHSPQRDIPDPYYGGPDGFEQVLDLIEASMAGLLRDVQARLATPEE